MICGGPGCTNEIPRSDGPGRPQVFCSDRCRRRQARAGRHVQRASDVLDLLRTVPTVVGVAALASTSQADLARIEAIARRGAVQSIRRISETLGASGNDTDVIVTPKGKTPR